MGVTGTSGWLLAVDFGTSNTAAADVEETAGLVRAVPLSHQGTLMASAVHVSSADQIDVGEVARNRAADDPGGFVAEPKWQLSLGRVTCPVGPLDVPMRSVVAAVLRAALVRAQERHQGRPPSRVVLTHPQRWNSEQVGVLVAAADEIGIPAVMIQTVSEPTAAAHYYAQTVEVQAGDRLVVFDFGSGILSVTVFAVAADGSFQVLASHDDDSLCGRNFDAVIRNWVGLRLAQVNSQLRARLLDGDVSALDMLALEDSVRQAKELLSETEMANIDVRAGDMQERVVLTRREFERLAAPEVERAIRFTYATLESAGIHRPAELTALYLTGGSARIPLLRHRLAELGPVATLDDFKTAVAEGALMAVGYGSTAVAPASRSGRELVNQPPVYRSQRPGRRRAPGVRVLAAAVAGIAFAGVLATAIALGAAHGRHAGADSDSTVAAVASAASSAAVATGDSPAPAAGAAPQTDGPQPAGLPSATTPAAAVPLDPRSSPDPVCAGLSGDFVTSGSPGGQDTPAHLVAAVMYARYVRRDPGAFTALYAAPPPANQVESVIAQVPAGTRYCVAATVTGPTTVRVVFQQQYPGMALSSPQAETWTVSGSAPYTLDRVVS